MTTGEIVEQSKEYIKKNIEKQEELDTKKSYQKKTFTWHKYITVRK